MTLRTPILLLAGVLLLGCGDPGRDLTRVTGLIDGGDDEAAEDQLRAALERHPEDVELLLVAADFYLRAHAEEHYKPRLSLHYAMRADRAANYQEPRATAAMVRAHRGTGGFEEGDALVREGLAGLNHPDAEAPVQLSPVDPDLVAPSPENLQEQRRRAAAGPDRCASGLHLVPAGRYPLTDGTEAVVEAPFCVEEVGRPVPASCATRELRDCDATETTVVRGPVAGLLQGAITDHRCCAPIDLGR